MGGMSMGNWKVVALVAAASLGLGGCARQVAAPLATVKTPLAVTQPTSPSLPALAELTAELPQVEAAAPDFGSAAIGAVVPGSSAVIDEAGAPDGATADGADFSLQTAANVRNQVLLAVQPKAAYRVAAFAESTGGRVVQTLDVGSTYQLVTLPAGMTVEQAKLQYAKVTGVTAVLPNRVYGVTMAPNDPYYEKQWGSNQVKAPVAWDRPVDCSNMTVAVLDTGIDYRHPELAGRVMVGWNFADNNNDVLDRFGHGTHVAGIIGAAGNNGIGVAGVAWNVKLMAVKVLSDSGQGTTAAVVAGIRYAADYGAKIINMSLGSPDTTIDPALAAAINYANSKGVMVIAAAGNNHGEVGSPANDPGAIAVSSTSKFLFWEYKSWFSNHGAKIELAAPGGSIWSTVPLDPNKTGATGYAKLSGTSMAAPMVAGEAAMIWARHPSWGALQVHQALRTAVDHKGSEGRNSSYGFGRINLELASTL